VPDCLLFADPHKKALAIAETKDDRRYRHGLAILEAKRWLRPLDRGDGQDAFDPDAPSSQMLRYLSRIDVASDRAIKWGMLTNGAIWRLYWQDARSRAEEFFEVDLSAALGVPGVQHELDEIEPDHALRLFFLFFHPRRLPAAKLGQHRPHLPRLRLNEARLYEEKVSQDLGARVFADIFPQLADALARGDLHARTHEIGYGQFKRKQFTPDYLDEVREAALVLLYRLLFLFYAEDRNLLPVRDARYAPYSVRRIREEVRDKVDAGGTFSSTMTKVWLNLQGVFELIDEGDDDIGMPAYNGGLFNRARSLLLTRTKVPDKVMAPIIDALSRRTEELLRGWINYRDLSVSHLGGIYERLLEYTPGARGAGQRRLQGQARDQPHRGPARQLRTQGLGQLLHPRRPGAPDLRESVGLLASERRTLRDAHQEAAKRPRSTRRLGCAGRHRPGQPDAGTQDLRPGHGQRPLSGGAGRRLADRVLEAITTATHTVNEPALGGAPGGKRPPLAKPGAATHRGDSPQHQDHRQRPRLGRDRCPAGRPPHRAPHDLEENHLRRRQEPHGRGAGQDRAMAAHLHRRRAALLPGPPPEDRRQPAWRAVATGAAQPAATGRAAAAKRVRPPALAARTWPRWPT
jgi:hypothetical protein